MGRSGGVQRDGLGLGRAGWSLAAGAALASLIGGTAQAQSQVQTQTLPTAPPRGDFPATTSEADILHWVATRTSIPRGAILIIEPRAGD